MARRNEVKRNRRPHTGSHSNPKKDKSLSLKDGLKKAHKLSQVMEKQGGVALSVRPYISPFIFGNKDAPPTLTVLYYPFLLPHALERPEFEETRKLGSFVTKKEDDEIDAVPYLLENWRTLPIDQELKLRKWKVDGSKGRFKVSAPLLTVQSLSTQAPYLQVDVGVHTLLVFPYFGLGEIAQNKQKVQAWSQRMVHSWEIAQQLSSALERPLIYLEENIELFVPAVRQRLKEEMAEHEQEAIFARLAQTEDMISPRTGKPILRADKERTYFGAVRGTEGGYGKFEILPSTKPPTLAQEFIDLSNRLKAGGEKIRRPIFILQIVDDCGVGIEEVDVSGKELIGEDLALGQMEQYGLITDTGLVEGEYKVDPSKRPPLFSLIGDLKKWKGSGTEGFQRQLIAMQLGLPATGNLGYLGRPFGDFKHPDDIRGRGSLFMQLGAWHTLNIGLREDNIFVLTVVGKECSARPEKERTYTGANGRERFPIDMEALKTGLTGFMQNYPEATILLDAKVNTITGEEWKGVQSALKTTVLPQGGSVFAYQVPGAVPKPQLDAPLTTSLRTSGPQISLRERTVNVSENTPVAQWIVVIGKQRKTKRLYVITRSDMPSPEWWNAPDVSGSLEALEKLGHFEKQVAQVPPPRGKRNKFPHPMDMRNLVWTLVNSDEIVKQGFAPYSAWKEYLGVQGAQETRAQKYILGSRGAQKVQQEKLERSFKSIERWKLAYQEAQKLGTAGLFILSGDEDRAADLAGKSDKAEDVARNYKAQKADLEKTVRHISDDPPQVQLPFWKAYDKVLREFWSSFSFFESRLRTAIKDAGAAKRNTKKVWAWESDLGRISRAKKLLRDQVEINRTKIKDQKDAIAEDERNVQEGDVAIVDQQSAMEWIEGERELPALLQDTAMPVPYVYAIFENGAAAQLNFNMDKADQLWKQPGWKYQSLDNYLLDPFWLEITTLIQMGMDKIQAHKMQGASHTYESHPLLGSGELEKRSRETIAQDFEQKGQQKSANRIRATMQSSRTIKDVGERDQVKKEQRTGNALLKSLGAPSRYDKKGWLKGGAEERLYRNLWVMSGGAVLSPIKKELQAAVESQDKEEVKRLRKLLAETEKKIEKFRTAKRDSKKGWMIRVTDPTGKSKLGHWITLKEYEREQGRRSSMMARTEKAARIMEGYATYLECFVPATLAYARIKQTMDGYKPPAFPDFIHETKQEARKSDVARAEAKIEILKKKKKKKEISKAEFQYEKMLQEGIIQKYGKESDFEELLMPQKWGADVPKVNLILPTFSSRTVGSSRQMGRMETLAWAYRFIYDATQESQKGLLTFTSEKQAERMGVAGNRLFDPPTPTSLVWRARTRNLIGATRQDPYPTFTKTFLTPQEVDGETVTNAELLTFMVGWGEGRGEAIGTGKESYIEWSVADQAYLKNVYNNYIGSLSPETIRSPNTILSYLQRVIRVRFASISD